MLRARAASAGRLRYRLLGSYANGQSYATVVAATAGFATLTPTDIQSTGVLGATRVHTILSKSLTLTAGEDGAGMYMAITDETDSKVLLAWPATSNITPLAVDGTVTVPAFNFANTLQPTPMV